MVGIVISTMLEKVVARHLYTKKSGFKRLRKHCNRDSLRFNVVPRGVLLLLLFLSKISYSS